MDDLISLDLSERYYDLTDHAIEQNYQKAIQYIDYEKNIVNKIEEIFKLNGLV